MTDKELYTLIHNELFKTGSCFPNKWYLIVVIENNKRMIIESLYPTKGNMRIRKAIKKAGINDDGEQVYLYDLYRFTNKKELKYEGVIEGVPSFTIEEVNNKIKSLEALT